MHPYQNPNPEHLVTVNPAWRGAFIGLGPLILAFLSGFVDNRFWADWTLTREWFLGLSHVSAALVYTAPLFLHRHHRMGQVFVTVGILLAILLAIPGLVSHPGLALIYVAGLIVVLLGVWPLQIPPEFVSRHQLIVHSKAPAHQQRSFATGAAITTLLSYLTTIIIPVTHQLDVVVVVATAELGCGYLAYRNIHHKDLSHHHRRFSSLALLIPIIGALLSWSSPTIALTWLCPLPFAAFFGSRVLNLTSSQGGTWWEPLLERPAPLLVSTFAAICAVGCVLLVLPMSSHTGHPVAAIDALFISTSATCVTGLATVDPPTQFTFFGQLLIALLIQVGGLGIMTLYTAVFTFVGKRLSLRHEGAVANLVSQEDRGDLAAALRRVLVVTGICELTGAALLFVLFCFEGDPWTTAIWRGVFTSISAFCNAGFALQSDSLVSYQHNPLILHTVSLLIIAGGLGPAVATSLAGITKRAHTPVGIKLALWMSIFLLIAGFVTYAALEWQQSLSSLSAIDKLHNAWFQSVTLRTAGFNSVDLTETHKTTFNMMVVWMFIGGCPGSTAGGIKTTTAALLLLAVWTAIRGQAHGTIFRVRIPHTTIYKAAAITTISILVHLVAFSALQLTQSIPTNAALFEVVSAMGTVGLTLGGTAGLDEVGKVIIIICMFVGRVGPLTLFLLLADQTSQSDLQRPEEDVPVG